MARDFSDEYVKSLRFPNYPLVHAGIAARRLISSVRRLQRATLGSAPVSTAPVTPADFVVSSFEAGAEHFRQHGWVFVDPFFNESLHKELIDGWPKRAFFEPPSTILKGYDSGFGWRRSRQKEPKYLDRHPALNQTFAHFRSAEFARRVSSFAGWGCDVSCFSLLATHTWPGSNVAPHRDSIAYTPQGEHFLNMVIFVNGTGGDNSGGLAILKDNTFSDVIFETRNLWNTALIYASGAPFYHGFPPVSWSKFRWAIATQFCEESYYGRGD